MWAKLVSPEPVLLCPHRVCPLSVRVPISSYKVTSQVGLGPTLMTSVHLSYHLMDPIFKYSHVGVWASTYGFWGIQFSPQHPQLTVPCMSSCSGGFQSWPQLSFCSFLAAFQNFLGLKRDYLLPLHLNQNLWSSMCCLQWSSLIKRSLKHLARRGLR